jgi:hypothetical protein
MSEPWSADALDSPAVLHESASVPRVHAEDVAPAHAVSDRPSNLRR